jgi:DNA-binding NarL/FixJ family response regulator
MDERAGNVSFFDGRVQVLGLSTPDTVDEVGEVIAARLPPGTRSFVGAYPALIAEPVFVAPGQVSVRSVKNVADRVVAIEQAAADAGEQVLTFLTQALRVETADIFPTTGPLDLAAFMQLTDLAGIEAARAITQSCPFVKTIMLTVSESEEHVSQALAAGAQGYVLKGTSGPELINTMRAVARGESYVSPGLAARLLTIARRPPPSSNDAGDLPELTRREEGILDHVARGMTNKEIARTLNISEKTVKHYMTNIMQKLHVRNRVEAALAAQKMGASSVSLKHGL